MPPVTKIDPLSGRKRGNDNHHHREGRNDYETYEDRLQNAAGTDYRRTVMTDDDDDDGNMSDTSEDDVFYTPNTSPRMSIASTRSGGSSARLSRRSPGTSRKSSRRSLKMATMSRQLSAGSATNSETSTSKTGTTPLRPPVTKSKTEIDSVPDKTQLHGTIAGSQSSFGRGHTSASSLSSTSPDVYSSFSQPMSNPTTRTSSPPRSDPSRDREGNAGRSERARSDETHADVDEEWTQDDGWSNDQPAYGSSSSKRKPVPPIPNGNAGHTQSRKSNKLFKAMSKANPSIMMNMTALLEEEEDVITSGNLSSRAYANGSHPQSNVLVVQQESSRASSKPTVSSTYQSPDDSFRSTLHQTTATSTPDTSLASAKSRDTAMSSPKYNGNRNSNLRHRPSRSHEDLRSSSRSGSHSRSVSITELASLPMPSGDLPSQGTPGFTSLVLPRAPPPSALAARSQGPKIEPSTDGKVDLTRSGIAQTTMATVEVVHGLGATAKSKGLLGALGRKMSLSRRKTVPVRTSLDRPRARRSEDNTTAMGARELNDHQPLGFTSYRKPPDYVPSSCVLVQVWAVGVDGVDARLVGLRVGGRSSNDSFRQANTMNGHIKRGGSLRWNLVRSAAASADQELQQPLVGYIPGRSFAGRVLECGWGVEDEIVKKGDWVVGLLDVRKVS